MASGRGLRAVISGIGVVSPFGVGKERFWQGVSRGESGTRLITEFDTEGLPCRVAAAVPPVTIDDAVTLTVHGPAGESGETTRPCVVGQTPGGIPERR